MRATDTNNLPDYFDLADATDRIRRVLYTNFGLRGHNLEDATQDTLMELVRTDPKHFWGPESMPTLIFMKCRQTVTELRRKMYGHGDCRPLIVPFDPLDGFPERADEDPDPLEQSEIQDLMDEQLSKLPAVQQELFYRRYYEKQSWARISEDFEGSVKYLKKLHTRTLRALRQALHQRGITL